MVMPPRKINSPMLMYKGPKYPKILCLASRMFVSRCSIIMVNKSKLCSQHTDAHLDALLKVAQSLIPHYDAVVQIKIRQAPLLVPIIHLLMF